MLEDIDFRFCYTKAESSPSSSRTIYQKKKHLKNSFKLFVGALDYRIVVK